MSRGRWVVLLAVPLLLAGCTTIPSSSSPQVVRTLNRGNSGSPAASITPEPGEEPREVVNKFIAAGVLAGAQHSSSRQFLTGTEARKWQDGTTIVLDNEAIVRPSNEVGNRATVVVTARRIGQVDPHGIYTPTLKNLGKGDTESFSYRLVKVSGQWRIDQAPAGVLVRESDFEASFPPSTLYFLSSATPDNTQLALVPDLRYSSLTGQALATWLLGELLTGARPDLVQAVLSEVPDQVNKPVVQLGDPITVEMPGTSGLDVAGRNALAAQLAYSFATFEYGGAQLMITDGGRPVAIPVAGGTTFSYQDHFNLISPTEPTTVAKAYYLRQGAVIDGTTDHALPGLLGQPGQLGSVALWDSPNGLQVAGVQGNSLLVGNDSKLTKVSGLPPGELSRPEWRPHTNEVWVGAKNAIYRVTPGHPAQAVSITSAVGGGLTGQVLALRFSSDGVRFAAAVRAPDGTSAAWVGAVVTSGTENIRIDSLGPVTPAQLEVTDVAWADDPNVAWAVDTELSVIGAVAGLNGGAAQVWQLVWDGSKLTSTKITNSGLAGGPPTAIAEGDGGPTLVSASGFIWAWSVKSSEWTSYPSTKASSQGFNPIYSQ